MWRAWRRRRRAAWAQEAERAAAEKKFDALCFDFGIELDEVITDRERIAREQGAAAAEEQAKLAGPNFDRVQ